MHAECVRDWPASRKCHCTGCCENFSCVANFDKHRDNGICMSPTKAGLVKNDRGIWTQPGEVDIRARFGK